MNQFLIENLFISLGVIAISISGMLSVFRSSLQFEPVGLVLSIGACAFGCLYGLDYFLESLEKLRKLKAAAK